MRRLGSIFPGLGLVAMIAGCDRPSPVDVPRIAAAASYDAVGGKPEIDPTYANGKTVYMIGPRMIVNARETQPNLYEHAEELYLVVYPQQVEPTPSSPPITLLSGYHPQCNPCFHPGLPAPFVFHDHVIAGAPGMGTDGTAGAMKAPWKMILLIYNPAYIASPFFTPIKSEKDLDAAEEAGNVFLPVNQGGENPYEIDTGNVLICPIVSSHA
jgi:hypothetical protein